MYVLLPDDDSIGTKYGAGVGSEGGGTVHFSTSTGTNETLPDGVSTVL